MDDSFAIPTSLRVLIWTPFEVITVPNTYSTAITSKFLSTDEIVHDNIDSAREDDSSNDNNGDEIFGESKEAKEKKLRQVSPFGGLQNWTTRTFIAKNGDVVLQELFALQLIKQFSKIFQEEGLPLYICTYNIYCVTAKSGLIEVVPNSVSFHNLKEKTNEMKLMDFFKNNGLTQRSSIKQEKILYPL